MSFTHQHVQSVSTTDGQVSSNVSKTANAQIAIDEAIADAETDAQIDIAIDVSQLKSFYIKSDQAVTIETNDGTSPDDTLVLVADQAYMWNDTSYDTFKLASADITALFVTNASGSTANISIRALVDPTV